MEFFSEKGPNRIKELWGELKDIPVFFIKEAATTLIIVKGSKLHFFQRKTKFSIR